MTRMQLLVEWFHKRGGHTVGDDPALRDLALRKRLVLEEAQEFADACDAGDLVEAIDALCDLLYVTFGSAVAFGVDLDPFFEEVHRSNMAKLTAGKDPGGKQLKPDGWEPPDIAGVLAGVLERARHG